MDMEQIRQRIVQAFEDDPSKSKGGLAAALKLRPSGVTDLLRPGGRKLSAVELPKAERYLGISLRCERDRDSISNEEAESNQSRDDTDSPSEAVNVPEYDVRGGAAYAGGFVQSDGIARATWGMPAPFLRDELKIRPGRVHVIPVRGDSMTDALFDGDRAIIDLDDIDVSQGGIFALLDDNASVLIKQVELVRGLELGRIRCKSRNPHYEPFELILDERVRIIGRVACKISRL